VASVLALLAAVGFGISDVTGAVAARRLSALTVTLGIQAVGLVALLPVLVLLPGQASLGALATGGVAGVFGSVGLVLYLRAMATGKIGVVSPVAALVGAAVPVGWGVVLAGDALSSRQLVGIVLGLIAVVAVASGPPGSDRRAGARSVTAAVVSGAAFGLFFVALDASPPDSGLWPVLGSRLAAITVLTVTIISRGRALVPVGSGRLVAISGAGDVAGNVLFLLATRGGLLSLASLLASLYPVVALLVARWWLQERLTGLQAAGVLVALAATGLLVAGG